MATALTHALEELHASLAQALDTRDWEAIQSLDQRCRDLTTNALQQAGALSAAEQRQVHEQLRRIAFLYDELVAGCTADRNEAHRQLHNLNVGKQGIKAYQKQSRGY